MLTIYRFDNIDSALATADHLHKNGFIVEVKEMIHNHNRYQGHELVASVTERQAENLQHWVRGYLSGQESAGRVNIR